MALRTTMTAIISQLRQFGQAAPDDEFDGVIYWTDAQLQTIADRNGRRGTIKIQRVDPDYMIYRLVAPKGVLLEDSIKVYDEFGSELAGTFTYNSDTNEIVFDEPQASDEYRAYSLAVQINDALAELWQNKADQRFNYIDWKAQNNKMNMAQEYQHCVDRALFYRSKKIRTFDKKGRGKWFS